MHVAEISFNPTYSTTIHIYIYNIYIYNIYIYHYYYYPIIYIPFTIIYIYIVFYTVNTSTNSMSGVRRGGLTIQCEAPKIAKLVYNSNNYGLWLMVLITIVTGAYKPTYNWGGHIVYYISHLYPSRHITMILP